MRWDPKWSQVVPDLAAAVTVNANATEFVFTLREGHRWSDGTLFTAADLLFWYRDVLMNPIVTPTVPTWLRATKKPVEVDSEGPQHVRFRFASPNGLFLFNMAT